MGVEIMAPPGMEEMTSQLQSMFQNLGGQKQKARKLKIKDAMKLLIEEEAAKLVNPEELKQDAIDAVEQHGIVFIDEIDKICKRGESSGPDVSREGVQRDLLPLVEGCTVLPDLAMEPSAFSTTFARPPFLLPGEGLALRSVFPILR